MRDWQSQSHVKWYCKYHVVFVPKYRRRSIYGTLRRQVGGILRELCRQAEIGLVEGGRCQGSCRLNHATFSVLSSLIRTALTTDVFSGFNATVSSAVQFRVWRDQRRGWHSRAVTYSS